MQPLEGEYRIKLEQWLEEGGYDKLLEIARRTRKGDAEDLVQATVMRACMASSWAKYDPAKGSILEHLKMIMYRENGRYRSSLQKPDSPVRAVEFVDEQHAVDKTDRQQMAIDIEDAIGSLEEPYRTAFILVGVKGLTQGDAAKQMGYTRQWINYLVSEARAQLQEKLAAYAGRPDSTESYSNASDQYPPLAA